MLSNKRHVLQLAALMRAHGIERVVVAPGSRHIPVAQTLAHTPGFTLHPMTDLRAAGFFALGLSLHDSRPVAVVCSGSDLLNLLPAVAEARAQQVPMVVVSAHPAEDETGQPNHPSHPTGGAWGKWMKRCAVLPDSDTPQNARLCNLLINDTLLEARHHGRGPVHLALMMGEPLFEATTAELPEERVISRYEGLNPYNNDYEPLIGRLNRYKKRLVWAGQSNALFDFDKKTRGTLSKHFAWFAENLGMHTTAGLCTCRTEELLYPMEKNTQQLMSPELLITFGGATVSRRMNYFLSKYPPTEHWHICQDGRISDPFGSRLTTVVEMDPFEFFERVAPMMEDIPSPYPRQWQQLAARLPEPRFAYSAMAAVGRLIGGLPTPCLLHLAGSSAVSWAQMFRLPAGVEVQSNCGLRGFEGSLPTALGYAAASERMNFLVIGDLGFFYAMNALWCGQYGSNVRILLLNNGGAGLYHALPSFSPDPQLQQMVTGSHRASARAWCEDQGFAYTAAHNDDELATAMAAFLQPGITRQPLLLEVFTNSESDAELYKKHLKSLRNA